MILQTIVENKKEEVARQKKILPLAELRQLLADRPPTRDFSSAIRGRDCAVIAEVKRSSPSKGRIRGEFDPVAIARTYEENGAAAVSVLTERKFFEGRAAYVPQIGKAVSLPILRKDFIVDPYQIVETRVLGGDALLLIARVLKRGDCSTSSGSPRSWGSRPSWRSTTRTTWERQLRRERGSWE